MPVATPLDIAVLSSPVPIPGETGTIPGTSGTLDMEQKTNFGDVSNALTKGSGVVPPYGSGNRTQVIEEGDTPPPPSSVSSGTFKASDLDETGANVGGLAKEAGTPEDTKMELEFTTASAQKEAEDAQKAQENFDAQVDEYKKAYEGDMGEKKSFGESLEAAGEEYYATGALGLYSLGKALKAGREARKGEQSGMSAARGVKRADRKADRQARKDAGLKGKAKRLARRAQRRQRRDAYKEFKDYLKSEAEIQAANLET